MSAPAVPPLPPSCGEPPAVVLAGPCEADEGEHLFLLHRPVAVAAVRGAPSVMRCLWCGRTELVAS